MLQNNLDIRNFFTCNRPTDSSDNNNRSDVENQDTEEVTQPLVVTKERDNKTKSPSELSIPVSRETAMIAKAQALITITSCNYVP